MNATPVGYPVIEPGVVDLNPTVAYTVVVTGYAGTFVNCLAADVIAVAQKEVERAKTCSQTQPSKESPLPKIGPGARIDVNPTIDFAGYYANLVAAVAACQTAP